VSLRSAFAPIDAAYKAAVLHNTWGHLAPEPRKRHKGYLLFAFGEFGDMISIKSDFKGLSDSPWFYDALNDFMDKHSKRRGTVYRFDGDVMMCKNGKFKFLGKVTEVKL
jgi:hypothetical protein